MFVQAKSPPIWGIRGQTGKRNKLYQLYSSFHVELTLFIIFDDHIA